MITFLATIYKTIGLKNIIIILISLLIIGVYYYQSKTIDSLSSRVWRSDFNVTPFGFLAIGIKLLFHRASPFRAAIS